MLMTAKEADTILKRINFNMMNQWEQGMISSLKEQRLAGKVLTDKQINCLSRIYDRVGD